MSCFLCVVDDVTQIVVVGRCPRVNVCPNVSNSGLC